MVVQDLADTSQLEVECDLPALASDATRSFVDLPPNEGECPNWCENEEVFEVFENLAADDAQACDGSVEFVQLHCGREWVSPMGEKVCFYIGDYKTTCAGD